MFLGKGQTSYEHHTSVQQNFIGKMLALWQKAYSFLIPRVLSLPNRDCVTTPCSFIQINKQRNIAGPAKVWGNPTQKLLFLPGFLSGFLRKKYNCLEGR